MDATAEAQGPSSVTGAFRPEGGPPRHFLEIPDLSREELVAVLDRADRLKAGRERGRPLSGRTLAMIFRKSSTRTRRGSRCARG